MGTQGDADYRTKQAGLVKRAMRQRLHTGPMQTSLGSWEQAVVLPFALVAEMVDTLEASVAADLLLARASAVVQPGPRASLQAMSRVEDAVVAYREASAGGRTLGELVEAERVDLAENVKVLIQAMHARSSDQERKEWEIKNETKRVQIQLIEMRQLVVAQRAAAGTTHLHAVEPVMDEAQQLVSALVGGERERADYHADRLTFALAIETQDTAVMLP